VWVWKRKRERMEMGVVASVAVVAASTIQMSRGKVVM
jgi:hypothetical protein